MMTAMTVIAVMTVMIVITMMMVSVFADRSLSLIQIIGLAGVPVALDDGVGVETLKITI
jgi:hypothetical protein